MPHAGTGVLYGREFDGLLRWRTAGVRPAPLADVLRVHEWSYIAGLQRACEVRP